MPTNCKHISARRLNLRDGVTLVELLIVMAVIILLAGVTLPSFRTMLQDQKITQGSRIVKGMIENARARAIALGRPVAVVFDRVAVDPSAASGFNHVADNTCTRLSLGEVFPPYEGDWAGSTGVLTDTNSDSVPDTLTIEVAKVSSLYDADNNKWTGLVTSGDLIQLADHKQTFSIETLTFNPGPATVSVKFTNPPSYFAPGNALWNVASEVRFRMLRRPTKSLTGSVSLPRGVCVDLAQSGIGPSANSFWVAPRPPVTLPDYYGPVFMVFNASGRLEGSFYRQKTLAGVSSITIASPGVVHLLVGRTDQVEPTETLTGSDTEQFVPNLYDERNFWVSINPYSGAITSAPNGTGVPTASKPTDRLTARRFAISGKTTQE